MKPVIIIGGGGHAKVVADALRESGAGILGFTDRDASRPPFQGISRLGDDSIIASHGPDDVVLAMGIGSVGTSPLRADLFSRFKGLGFRFATVIHPRACVARDAVIGEGTVIFAGAVVQPGCVIGENVILNTRASVDHDSHIAAHVHIAPGSTLSGGVTVGERALIGVGCTIIQGLTIGRESLVGAGSVVVRDVPAGQRVFGVPARSIPGGGS